ncbi:MAG: glycoside hydrolase family 3 C-terminal domain-containing protein [Clostridia bacterium]|nr:glycoside hydrolase family 3 C-terminal domain-containing protein [Clostridia bacterium]
MFKEYESRAREILAKMSLKEKIGQLNQAVMPCEDEASKEAFRKRLRNGEIGSVILSLSATAGNDEQKAVVVEMLNDLQKTSVEEGPHGIPLLFGRDVIHGHHTVLPIPLASAASFDPALVTEAYRDVAEDARSEGTNWTFSPMMDICRDPRWGRIIEGYGEDPYLAGQMAAATVKGFQGEDLKDPDSILACAKHYLGYGFSEGGRDYHRTELSDYTVQNVVLAPFREAVKAGVGTVMSSFNDISGEPVTSSKKYLTDILRGQLGFEGFVISDWYSVQQLIRQGIAEEYEDCAHHAINAGLDMDMADEHYSRFLERFVNEGKVSEETVDTAVLRILCVKLAMGLFENTYASPKKVDRKAHIERAERMAAESMILLKNDKNVLPFPKKTRAALIGPYTFERRGLHGSWALDGYLGASTPNMAEAMDDVVAKEGGGCVMVTGGRLNDDSNYIFSHSDHIVLALGESHEDTGEARSVSDISLSPAQIELCKKARLTGRPTVGVVFCGRPVCLTEVEPYLDAILIAWHGGTRAAHAAVRTVFGDYNPCGRAPVTFVRRTGHIPLYYNVTCSGREVNGYYGEGASNCYTDYAGSPLYPFGYGISYTSFEYSVPVCDKTEISYDRLVAGEGFTVSVNVKNVGERVGKEVVQLYIRDPKASMMRPLRELKAFAKVEIAKGEEATVTFEIGSESLGFYKPDGTYVIEKGSFEIYVGPYSTSTQRLDVKVV